MAGVEERGQVTPFVALVVVLVAALVVMLGRLGQNATDQARAQTAADAAALAGVVEGEDAAAELAESNGAELLLFVADGEGVVVRVALRRAEARARAVASRPADGGDCARSAESWHSLSRPVMQSPRSVAGQTGDKGGDTISERSPGWPRAGVCGASSAGSTRGASSG